MLKQEIVYISFGSNIEDRRKYIEDAKKELLKLKIEIVKQSSWYKTEPVGKKDQPWFLNQVVKVKTSLAPLKMLFFAKNIETKLGRVSRDPGGPREIDIDILFYNDIQISSSELVLPHPRIQDRRFVLVPLSEIDPGFMHPVLRKTMKELLKTSSDVSSVEVFKSR